MESKVLNLLNRYATHLLVVAIMVLPFAVMTGCEKQYSMDMARAGQ